MNELKLPEPDTHCLDDEGGRPIDVWSYSPELVRQIVAADRAQKSARHLEELLAYEVTVGNLREQSQPERKPMTNDQITKLLDRVRMQWVSSPPTYEVAPAFARAVEAFHGIGGKP